MIGFDMIGMIAEFTVVGNVGKTIMNGRVVSLEFCEVLNTVVFTVVTESGNEVKLTHREINRFVK